MPLHNFQAGNVSYRNTCWLAAIMNLRGLIPGIIEVLGLQDSNWKNTILAARSFGGRNKYAYTVEDDGQGDAGEFLGDILYNCWGHSWTLRRTTKLCAVCEGMEAEVNEPHSWANDIQLPMMILSLPPVESHTAVLTMSELVALETAAQFQRDLLCSICERSRQSGVITKSFVGVPPNVFAIRILRFTQKAKRKDIVYPNPDLRISEVDYSLRAIVLHQGEDLDAGHYIMYLRTAAGWQRRDDNTCASAGNNELPSGMGKKQWSEVVVVVYKKHAALSVSETLAAEQARAHAIQKRAEDDERERRQKDDEIRRKEEADRKSALRRKEKEARQVKLCSTSFKLKTQYACACCPAEVLGQQGKKRKAEEEAGEAGEPEQDASAQQERSSWLKSYGFHVR